MYWFLKSNIYITKNSCKHNCQWKQFCLNNKYWPHYVFQAQFYYWQKESYKNVFLVDPHFCILNIDSNWFFHYTVKVTIQLFVLVFGTLFQCTLIYTFLNFALNLKWKLFCFVKFMKVSFCKILLFWQLFSHQNRIVETKTNLFL